MEIPKGHKHRRMDFFVRCRRTYVLNKSLDSVEKQMIYNIGLDHILKITLRKIIIVNLYNECLKSLQ